MEIYKTLVCRNGSDLDWKEAIMINCARTWMSGDARTWLPTLLQREGYCARASPRKRTAIEITMDENTNKHAHK